MTGQAWLSSVVIKCTVAIISEHAMNVLQLDTWIIANLKLLEVLLSLNPRMVPISSAHTTSTITIVVDYVATGYGSTRGYGGKCLFRATLT